MSNLNFKSKKLLEIDTEADFIVSSHLCQLDQISNDIKALENKLQKAAIPFTFIYVFSSKEKKYQDIRNCPYGEYKVNLIEYEDFCLVWEKHKENGFRLSSNIYLSKDECDEQYKNPHLRGKPILKYSKPLIETKSYVRLGIEKELSFFYKKIIESLKLDNKKDLIIVESPNYDGVMSQLSWRGFQSE